MFGGQEGAEAVHHMHPLHPHQRKEQRGTGIGLCHLDDEPAGIGLDQFGQATRAQDGVHAPDGFARTGGRVGPEGIALPFDMAQHGVDCGDGQRVTHEGSGKEGRDRLGTAIVAVGPRSAVQRVHKPRAAGEDADGHTAADDLSIGRHIALNAPDALHAASMRAEPGDDLIHHQCRAAVLRHLAQFAHKGFGAMCGMPALHRFHDDPGDLVDIGADPVERSGLSVGQDLHVDETAARDARRGGQRRRIPRRAASFDQNLVELAVIILVKDHDQVAARHRPGDPHRGHDRFGSGRAEGRALMPDQIGKAARDGTGEVRLWTNGHAAFQLRLDRAIDEIGRVAKGGLPEPVDEIDKAVAVDVVDIGTLGGLGDDREGQLFPFGAESGGGARVGVYVAELRGLVF